MSTHRGFLLIADITGYTSYLTRSELEHANPILRSLLEALVLQIGAPLHLWRLEGDAVLAYTTARGFPSGDTFLAICENLYQAFAARRLDIVQNTTCTCNACANVASLDLKIMAHHGEFEEMTIGPMTDISGADVILVHRMAKTDVTEATGIRSYALFSEDAVAAMGIDTPLLAYQTRFEHFGEVPLRVYDLARAWERHREAQAVVRVEPERAIYEFRHRLAVSAPIAWELLVQPALKKQWMHMRSVTMEPVDGRMGAGTRYHCIHEAAEFRYRVVDWRPFRYFSTVLSDPLHEGLRHDETYELHPVEGGVDLVYRMGPLVDAEGTRRRDAEPELIELGRQFWPGALAALDEMVRRPSD